jgi:hypothetical protein
LPNACGLACARISQMRFVFIFDLRFYAGLTGRYVSW